MHLIKFLQPVEIKGGTLICAWPGMGNVAYNAVGYLIKKLDTIEFARLDISSIILPEKIVVREGICNLAEFPPSSFYYKKPLDMVIFLGEVQLPNKEGLMILDNIIELCKIFSIKTIYSAAAFPQVMSYAEPHQAFFVANTKELRDKIYSMGFKILEDGQISGLNGLVLGYAQKSGIKAGCFLATMPAYAIHFSYLKASKVIVEALSRVLGFRVDMQEIDIQIGNAEKSLQEAEKRMAKLFEPEKTPPFTLEEKILKEDIHKIPSYVIEKIERLFKEAEKDKNKAYILKEELDKWELFKIYEDRFLDLFKKKHG